MPADVQVGTQLTVGVAHQDNGVLAHVGGDEIVVVGNLGLVTEQQPAAREDALQLQLVELLIDEDAAVDEPTLDINQPADIDTCHGSTLVVVSVL